MLRSSQLLRVGLATCLWAGCVAPEHDEHEHEPSVEASSGPAFMLETPDGQRWEFAGRHELAPWASERALGEGPVVILAPKEMQFRQVQDVMVALRELGVHDVGLRLHE